MQWTESLALELLLGRQTEEAPREQLHSTPALLTAAIVCGASQSSGLSVQRGTPTLELCPPGQQKWQELQTDMRPAALQQAGTKPEEASSKLVVMRSRSECPGTVLLMPAPQPLATCAGACTGCNHCGAEALRELVVAVQSWPVGSWDADLYKSGSS